MVSGTVGGRRKRVSGGRLVRRTPLMLVLLAVLFVAGACGQRTAAPAPKPAPPAGTATGSPFRHVFLIVMENLSYDAALKVPGFASLAQSEESATAFYAAAHPSLPNYIALTSGGTWGIRSDCVFCRVNRPNLGSQLTAKGVSWGAYMEGIPSSCWLLPWWPPTGYAAKHDPFSYYDQIRGDPTACAHIRPLTDLTSRLQGPASGVPSFVWITPNLCHDGHSCPDVQAAAWLAGMVRRITGSPAYRQGGLLVVTWDEGSGSDHRAVKGGRVVPSGGGGHVLTLVAHPGMRPGMRVTTPLTPYAILATIEQNFGLARLGRAATSPTLAAFWQGNVGAVSLRGG